MDDVKVLHVTRRGTEAVHFVESALPVGKMVKQKLDWERRLDHMQQHSGETRADNTVDCMQEEPGLNSKWVIDCFDRDLQDFIQSLQSDVIIHTEIQPGTSPILAQKCYHLSHFP
jgi:hypothetical protein